MICPKCGAAALEGARFCEACGTSLTPAAAAPGGRCRCGAGPDAKGSDGYCSVCGLRWPVPRPPLPRDHVERTLTPGFAGVTDRGKRHAINEDALALADVPGSGAVLIVSDGVSSAQNSEEASEIGAQTARTALETALRGVIADPASAMHEAISAAHQAACTVAYSPDKPKDPPGATLVAALVREGLATLGWLGDSRAYWIGPAEARLLTHDHSWVNAVVDAGEMPEEDALRAPEAHAITRCLGPLNGDAPEPTVITIPMTASGWLLLCSDGLWNYAPQTQQLADLVRSAPAGSEALAVCRMLVDYALSQGGKIRRRSRADFGYIRLHAGRAD